jgi:murein DD-endopeptidase MepM/ murein hydrolase activator NlpD
VDYCIDPAYFIFQRPIAPPGTDSTDRGYPYGSTEGGRRDPHHGVEFHTASGTPVLAVAEGTVYYAGDDSVRKFSPWSGFYGSIVVLEHRLSGAPFDTLYTLYAHLSKVDVSNGQVVASGEKIGEVGMTGTAFGNHLHFEVRVNPNDYTSTLNPDLWLVPHPGNGTMAFQFLDKNGKAIHPLEIKVQYITDPNHPSAADYYPEVYSFESLISTSPFQETAALGDLPAGRYRITFEYEGTLYRKEVEVQPGRLTRVRFTVK